MKTKHTAKNAGALPVLVFLALLSAALFSCATQPEGIPEPASPSSTLLVICAETKIREADKNFNLFNIQ